MSHLFHDPIAWALIGFGCVTSVLAIILCGRQHRQAAKTAGQLIYLALEGSPEKARVQARTAGRAMQPILRALNGELSPPSTRPYLQDFIWFAIIYTAPALLLVHTWQTLNQATGSMRLAGGLALFLGLAILVPLSLSASLFIVIGARRSARIVRGHCITMVARHVKGVVDAELSDALRRGTHPRDPRGE